MTKRLIAALFLSQALIGGVHAERDYYAGLRDNNPFSGARSMATDLVKDQWYTQKASVPYAFFWACPWRQTAQQCVAIVYILQQELRK